MIAYYNDLTVGYGVSMSRTLKDMMVFRAGSELIAES
jgi:hypothetical protein